MAGDEADRIAAEGDEGHLNDGECRHGLDARWCGACRVFEGPDRPDRLRRKPAPQPPTTARGFQRGGSDPGTLAEYNGTCAWCGDYIEAGVDRIVYDDVAPGWKHTVCP